VPGASLKIGPVNETTGRGRHTTSVTTCHELGDSWPAGALVVDTPGVRSFGLYGLDLTQIGHGFREFRALQTSCRFRNCLHEEEPDCGVRLALDAGEVDPGRYQRYRSVLESVRRGDG
jgi:ribosome biogenesis GTPase